MAGDSSGAGEGFVHPIGDAWWLREYPGAPSVSVFQAQEPEKREMPLNVSSFFIFFNHNVYSK